MFNVVIVRYGEIGTKARQTRRWFEGLLVNNMREALVEENVGYKKIEAKHGRILVKSNEARSAVEPLTRVFGIVSLSPAVEVDAELERIEKTAAKLFRRKRKELGLERPTFRVTARRITKEFPLKSPEVGARVGEYIYENEEADVDLHNPQIDVGIEIMYGKAYVFVDKIRAWGGLPIGTQGRVVALLSGSHSALAAFLMMKRGCEIIPLYIKRSEDELESVRKLWRKLKRYSYGSKGELIVSEGGNIIEKAQKTAEEFAAKGIVLGRYAKRFTDELGEILMEENAKARVPLFYPLLGLPDDYMEDVRRRVGL